MKRISTLLGAALAAFSMFASQPAGAEELHFKVNLKYNDRVRMDFHSTTRDHVWPAPGRSYILSTGTTQSINISCTPGEHVCYGAWVERDAKVFWGIGYQNQHRCTACCYYCDGGTPRVTLNN